MNMWGRSASLLAIALLGLAGCSRPTPTPTIPKSDLVQVPAGWFWMGEDDARRSNQPQHRVYLDTFEIQRTEVIRGDYIQYLAAIGYPAPDTDQSKLEASSQLPVVGVLWENADAYCRWIGMRLPTEAEWEKAARGDNGRHFPWGNEWDPNKANTSENGQGNVLPVGSFPDGASPYGLLDMCGNAAEWVADYYQASYYHDAPDRNPTGPTQVTDHVLRGGSFDSTYEQTTTYFRDSSHSVRPNLRVGFRCARSVETK